MSTDQTPFEIICETAGVATPVGTRPWVGRACGAVIQWKDL